MWSKKWLVLSMNELQIFKNEVSILDTRECPSFRV